MLKVDRYELIRREHIVKRKSINQLAREYHHSKRTIKKILNHITPPGYRRKKPIPMPVLGPFKDWIDNILESDRKLPKKQRHTAHRIYTRLVSEKDFQGCESGVRQYVRKRKQAHTETESFLRLSYEPGIDAQVDFGEAQVVMNGVQEKVHVLSMRLCYSSKSIQQCFPRETQECVFEGLRRIFEEINGVPENIWFHNFPAVVTTVLQGRDRIETQNFIGFRSHYLFNAIFCAPGKGNEKGHVETLVGYGRRNFMVPIPEVASFEELNENLLRDCRRDESREIKGKSVGKLFEEEVDRLLKLPTHPHPCRVKHKGKVNKFQEVTYDKKIYSVPLKYTGQKVLIHVGAFDIEIEHNHQIISRKKRVYRNTESGIDPMDYLDILERKARAVSHAKVLKDWKLPVVFGQIQAAIKKRYPEPEGDREYIRVLKLLKEFDLEIVEVAAGLALEYRSVGSDAVRSLCHQLESSLEKPIRIDLSDHSEAVQTLRSWSPDLTVYDRLLMGGISHDR